MSIELSKCKYCKNEDYVDEYDVCSPCSQKTWNIFSATDSQLSPSQYIETITAPALHLYNFTEISICDSNVELFGQSYSKEACNDGAYILQAFTPEWLKN